MKDSLVENKFYIPNSLTKNLFFKDIIDKCKNSNIIDDSAYVMVSYVKEYLYQSQKIKY